MERIAAPSGRLSHSGQDLRLRTRAFALRIIRLYHALPKTGEAKVIGSQLLRAGTSVGAHVAEACRAKSRADFVSKIDGAAQELEETLYWMDLIVDAEIVSSSKLAPLQLEASELMAILATLSKKTRET
ncbi:MAG: four helix bundle protein [bacterium]|nr:four helix bundle protein [bacterium]